MTRRPTRSVRSIPRAPALAEEPPSEHDGDRDASSQGASTSSGRTATSRTRLQTVELIATPFRSFREVGRFQEAVASVAGVSSVQPRTLERGSLQLRVDCRGAVDLAEALRATYHLPFDVLAHEPYLVEIMFTGFAAGGQAGEPALGAARPGA